jgi:acyl carrier protein
MNEPDNQRSSGIEESDTGSGDNLDLGAALSKEVYTILAEQLALHADDIRPESNLVDDLGADSLDLVELMMECEEAFGIEVPDDVQVKTVQDAVDFVKTNIVDLPGKLRELAEKRERERDIPKYSEVCSSCKQYRAHQRQRDAEARTCEAFPGGIPLPIWKGENDHTNTYPGDHGILYRRQRFIHISEPPKEVWEGAIAILQRELTEDTLTQVRELFAEDPEQWWLEHHMFFGMGVRNLLRKNGFGDDRFGDNLDDYWVELVERAAGIAEEEE